MGFFTTILVALRLQAGDVAADPITGINYIVRLNTQRNHLGYGDTEVTYVGRGDTQREYVARGDTHG